eukprot:GHVN01002014.1.p2 GENE.GHVN01002014.1~~GHVN01002014.1.p2  ORF type:complete len:285 (+),score=32.17 GHVN01002014.1:68-922(+)
MFLTQWLILFVGSVALPSPPLYFISMRGFTFVRQARHGMLETLMSGESRKKTGGKDKVPLDKGVAEDRIAKSLDKMDDKMTSTVKSTTGKLAPMTTTSARPEMLDDVLVGMPDGKRTKIRNLAGISVKDALTLKVDTFNKNNSPMIEQAILKSGMNLNPHVEKGIIWVGVPPMSYETRVEIVRKIRSLAEQGKALVRSARQQAIETIRDVEKIWDLSKDKKTLHRTEIERLTAKHMAAIEKSEKGRESLVSPPNPRVELTSHKLHKRIKFEMGGKGNKKRLEED